jgi:ABC-2 type transport system permease protein
MEATNEREVATPVPTAGDQRWFRQAWAFTERYLRVLVRNKAVLFWGVAFPAGFYLLTLALFMDFGRIPAEYHGQVKAVVAIGYGTFGAVIVCLNSFGQHLVEDLEDDRYKQFRALPLSPTADFAGRMFAGYLFMLGSVAVVLGVGVAAGASFTVRSAASVPLVLVALAGFAVLWMVVATVVAVLVRDARFASIIAVTVALLSYWSTGFNGTAVSMFAGPDEWLNLLPNTLATRVMVYHLVAIDDWAAAGMAPPAVPDGIASLGLLALYGAVCVVAGVAIVRGVVYDREVVA